MQITNSFNFTDIKYDVNKKKLTFKWVDEAGTKLERNATGLINSNEIAEAIQYIIEEFYCKEEE